MNRLAVEKGLAPPVSLHLVAEAGHSFREMMDRGLAEQAEQLFRAAWPMDPGTRDLSLERDPTPEPPKGCR